MYISRLGQNWPVSVNEGHWWSSVLMNRSAVTASEHCFSDGRDGVCDHGTHRRIQVPAQTSRALHALHRGLHVPHLSHLCHKRTWDTNAPLMSFSSDYEESLVWSLDPVSSLCLSAGWHLRLHAVGPLCRRDIDSVWSADWGHRHRLVLRWGWSLLLHVRWSWWGIRGWWSIRWLCSGATGPH